MNLYYGLAVMATRGSVSAVDYSPDRIADPDVLAFIKRIEAFEDPKIESMGPAYRHGCDLSVTTTDGALHARRILARRGSPENDVDAAEIEDKFRNNTAALLTVASQNRLVELVLAFDELSDVEPVNALLRV